MLNVLIDAKDFQEVLAKRKATKVTPELPTETPKPTTRTRNAPKE